MIKVNKDFFTLEKAEKDAKYCLRMASRPVSMNIDDPSKYFIQNQHVYMNTSDNTRMVTSLESGRKNILTVASSGEYIIDSSLNGADRIISYDINEFQYYMSEFKIWALEKLTYNEFIEFFIDIRSDNYLSPIYMNKILEGHENTPTYMFFKAIKDQREIEESSYPEIFNIYKEYKDYFKSNDEADESLIKFVILTQVGPKFKPQIFQASRIFETNSTPKENVGFLINEEEYNKAREKVKNTDISFILSNVVNLSSNIGNDSFDEIHLSNIPTYLTVPEYLETVKKLNEKLNPNGLISVYNQSMNKIWFQLKKKDKGFKVPDYEFSKYGNDLRGFGTTSVDRLLQGYKAISREKFRTKLIEHPGSDGGTTTVKKDVELKIYKK